jgi:(R)-amidase
MGWPARAPSPRSRPVRPRRGEVPRAYKQRSAFSRHGSQANPKEEDVRALLAQLNPKIGAVRNNAERAAQAIAGYPQADIAVFPELFLSGYTYRGLEEASREQDADELRLVQAAAAEANTAVVIGFAERHKGGLSNSAACIDNDGRLAAIYRKTLLFGEETEIFTAGKELMLVPLAGRKVAPLICFDIEFPEPARRVAQAGAELIATASANFKPFALDHSIPALSRAIENRLPHLYVNMVGPGDGLEFVGGSRSMSPLGVILYEAPPDQEDLAVVAVGDRADVDERSDYVSLVRQMPKVSDLSQSVEDVPAPSPSIDAAYGER